MEHLEMPLEMVKDLEGLKLLTAGLERITGGGAIDVRASVIIETENMPAFFLIQDLVDPDHHYPPAPLGAAKFLAREKAIIKHKPGRKAKSDGGGGETHPDPRRLGSARDR
jgi:hypothetical protein